LKILICLVAAWAVSGLLGCAAGERPPQLAGAVEPDYPAAARAQGIEGYVLVEYDVTAEGMVTNARVVESDPPGVFDAAALTAVSKWRFHPSKNAAAARSVNQVSRLTFNIGDGNDYGGYE